MNFARLWVCTGCQTVVATNAERPTRPEETLGSCPNCGNVGFTSARLAASEEEAARKAEAGRERRRAEQ